MNQEVNRGEFRNYFPFVDDEDVFYLNAQEGVSEAEQVLKHRILSSSAGSTLERLASKAEDSQIAALLLALSNLSKKGMNVSLDSRRMPRNFTIRKSGEISFLPRGKDSLLSGEGRWAREGRLESDRYGAHFIKPLWAHFRMQVAKGIIPLYHVPESLKGFLGSGLPSALMEQTHNHLCSHLKFAVLGEFKEVEGEELRRYYGENTYDYNQNIGTLKDSCLRDTSFYITNSLDLYVDNPESVSLLILTSPDRSDLIIGRALIWKGVSIQMRGKEEVKEDQVLLDRIYTSDAAVGAFKKFAKERGWYHKTNQDYSSGLSLTTPEGVKGEFIVRTPELFVARPKRFPFLDTLFIIQKAKAVDDRKPSEGVIVELTNTNMFEPCSQVILQSVPEEYDYDAGDELEQDTRPHPTSSVDRWLRELFETELKLDRQGVLKTLLELADRVDFKSGTSFGFLLQVHPEFGKMAIEEAIAQAQSPLIMHEDRSSRLTFLSSSIFHGFTWSSTRKGHEFWSCIYNSMRRASDLSRPITAESLEDDLKVALVLSQTPLI